MGYTKKLTTTRGGTNVTSSGASGNVLTSNGTDWSSSTPSAAGVGNFVIATKTANFTASDGASYYYRVTTNSVTCTLPATPADGSVRKFKTVTSGKTTTFALDGSDTINHEDGTSDQSLTLAYGAGVIELIAVSGGWDIT